MQQGELEDSAPENVNSYIESRSTREVFNSLIERVKALKPEADFCFNEPATESQIKELEQHLKITLPNDVKELYLLANGQKNKDEVESLSLFTNGYQFLSLNEIRECYQFLVMCSERNDSFCDLYDIQGAVYGYWWNLKWIPIGYFMTGDYVCIDLVPSPKGKIGQIISFIHDDSSRDHLGFSLRDYLGSIDQGLHSGVFFIHDEYNLITDSE
jgi:cell wall assembly regulator SMI1